MLLSEHLQVFYLAQNSIRKRLLIQPSLTCGAQEEFKGRRTFYQPWRGPPTAGRLLCSSPWYVTLSMIKNTNKTIIINIYFFYIFPFLKAPTVKNNQAFIFIAFLSKYKTTAFQAHKIKMFWQSVHFIYFSLTRSWGRCQRKRKSTLRSTSDSSPGSQRR